MRQVVLRRFFAGLCILLAATVPALAQDGPTDVELATTLRGILSEVGGYSDVSLTVNEGVVTFEGTANSLVEAEALEDLALRVDGIITVRNNVTETADIAKRLNPALERFTGRVQQILVSLPLLLIAGAIFAVIVFAGFLIARMKQPWDRLAPNAFLADIYRQILRIAFIVIGLVIALDVLNATALLGTFLGAAGLIGLAIGFAVRDTVENFLASVMLSLRQPFQPDDLVDIEGSTGRVIRLTSRATILLDMDGNHIRLPNATVFKGRIINYSRNPERRFSFEIGVASDADLAAVRTLAEETVASLPFALAQPAPAVWVERIGDGAVFLTVTGWIDQRSADPLRARGEALRSVKEAIEAGGVEVPDTTYRIQLMGEGSGTVTETDRRLTPPPLQPSAALPPGADDLAQADPTLNRLVEQERADPDTPNLLTEDGPEE